MPITDPFCLSLISKGFFPRSAVPLYSSESFAAWIATQNIDEHQRHYPRSTDLVFHSTPKDSRTRRIHGLPNPSSYARLCISIARHWPEISSKFGNSAISTSCPLISSADSRAIKYFNQNKFLEKRILAGAGKRWYLKTDLAAFYPSVYLHAIEWAIDGRPDLTNGRMQNGIGGKIDCFSRALQGQRSVGLPIGPDTSAIISEILLTQIDQALADAGHVAVRHVDDIYVYSESRDNAEAALSVLSKVCSDYMLELNGRKTEIEPMVDSFDAAWKSLPDHQDGGLLLNTPKRLVAFFDSAFRLAKEHRDDSVMKYMTKASWKAVQGYPSLWPRYISLLLHSITLDSRSVDTVTAILHEVRATGAAMNDEQIFDVFSAFVKRHAMLQNGFEVSWGLWCLRALDLLSAFMLPADVVSSVVAMNDDMSVTQLALYATQNLAAVPELKDWTARASAARGCHDSHWLFTYEAKLRGWARGRIDGSEPNLLGSSLRAGISFIDESPLGTFSSTNWAHPYLSLQKLGVTDDSDDSNDLVFVDY